MSRESYATPNRAPSLMNAGPRPSLLQCARVEGRPSTSNAGSPARYNLWSSNTGFLRLRFRRQVCRPRAIAQSRAPPPTIAAAIAAPIARRASATGEPTSRTYRTYRSAIAVVLCPSRSRSTCVPTPAAAAFVMTVRCRSCSRTSVSPASRATAAKWVRAVRYVNGPRASTANTWSFLFNRGRERMTASAASGKSCTRRPVFVSGSVTRPLSKSTCSQRIEHTSDIRSPVSAATRIAATLAGYLSSSRSRAAASAGPGPVGHARREVDHPSAGSHRRARSRGRPPSGKDTRWPRDQENRTAGGQWAQGGYGAQVSLGLPTSVSRTSRAARVARRRLALHVAAGNAVTETANGPAAEEPSPVWRAQHFTGRRRRLHASVQNRIPR